MLPLLRMVHLLLRIGAPLRRSVTEVLVEVALPDGAIAPDEAPRAVALVLRELAHEATICAPPGATATAIAESIAPAPGVLHVTRELSVAIWFPIAQVALIGDPPAPWRAPVVDEVQAGDIQLAPAGDPAVLHLAFVRAILTALGPAVNPMPVRATIKEGARVLSAIGKVGLALAFKSIFHPLAHIGARGFRVGRLVAALTMAQTVLELASVDPLPGPAALAELKDTVARAYAPVELAIVDRVVAPDQTTPAVSIAQLEFARISCAATVVVDPKAVHVVLGPLAHVEIPAAKKLEAHAVSFVSCI
mmetsp:Transcript_48142/g.99621  ORF Transcript_48142/g.99621 Transcript_48142/m.99621 type:complete len:305 (+) Transcript_48142:205-1119(+)